MITRQNSYTNCQNSQHASNPVNILAKPLEKQDRMMSQLNRRKSYGPSSTQKKGKISNENWHACDGKYTQFQKDTLWIHWLPLQTRSRSSDPVRVIFNQGSPGDFLYLYTPVHQILRIWLFSWIEMVSSIFKLQENFAYYHEEHLREAIMNSASLNYTLIKKEGNFPTFLKGEFL